MREFRINHWHSDGGPFPVPPLAAILMAYEVPEAGGDTMWASMYAAYDALSPHMQRMLDSMQNREQQRPHQRFSSPRSTFIRRWW